MMLISKTMVHVLEMIKCGRLSHLVNADLEIQLQSLLRDCLQQIRQAQQPDGSWGLFGPYEETSYALLALISLLGSSSFDEERRVVENSIEQGRKFLEGTESVSCEYLWIEKTTYGSQFLADAYVFCALHAQPEAPEYAADTP